MWKVYHSIIPEQQVILPCGFRLPFQGGKFATDVKKVQDKIEAYIPDSDGCIYIKEGDYEYDVKNPLDIKDFNKRKELLAQLAAIGGTVVFDSAEGAEAARALGVTTSRTLSAAGTSADSNGSAQTTSTGGVKVNLATASK